MERRIGTSQSLKQHLQRGQALVEYALIIVLLVFAFVFVLQATGPALNNVFNNVVNSLVAEAGTPQPDIESRGGPTQFWLTVTWAASNREQGRPFPTNLPPPPTEPPTEGPPPPATNTPLPTNTPTQTATPGPTATLADMAFVAPFEDPMTEPDHWRVDNSVFLGSALWRVEYFPNTTLSGSPDFDDFKQDVSMLPASGQPPVSGWLSTNYSTRWTKAIYLAQPTRVTFSLSSDDGVRLWLLPAGQQAGSCLSGSGVSSPPTPGQSNGQSNRVFGDPATHCLLVDDWQSQGMNSTPAVTRTIPAGAYTLQIDHYQGGGGHGLTMSTSGGGGMGSPDDSNLAGGAPLCTWTHADTSRANSFQDAKFMWEENGSGDFPANMLCHLEFRGYVEIPAGMTNPEFTFWDVWDFGNGNTRAWVEFAEYIPTSDPGYGWGVERGPSGVVWQRPAASNPLRVGPSSNYAWTFNRVDLAALGFQPGDQVTFRFVIQNSGGGNNRRWYVDDIAVQQSSTGTNTYTVGDFWDLETPNQEADFITSGRWARVAAGSKARGAYSWHESPGNSQRYDVNWEGTERVHYIEFNGRIDLSGSTPDLEGDTGAPLLSFYHAYEIARDARLEVQYTRDPYNALPATWTTIPAVGTILPSATSTRTQASLVFYEVALENIPNYNTQPFRLRFALIINTTDGGRVADGWYIDEIYIERDEVERFSYYPFLDTAESANSFWRSSGQWDRTTENGVFDSLASYADSPNRDYVRGDDSTLTIRYPFDLNDDTPENQTLYGGNIHYASNPGAGLLIQGTPENVATNPVLTFWHYRNLNSGAALYVEWRRADESNNWTALWSYQYGNSTSGSVYNETGINLAWERVEVDMGQGIIAYNPTDGNLYDDDILIRFRLDVRNSNARDGVYVDNILIENRRDNVWDLRPAAAGGDGVTWIETFEVNDWVNRWWTGGDWFTVEYEAHTGLRSLHESGFDQTAAPPNGQLQPEPAMNEMRSRHDTYQVLEIQPIFDLTGVDPNVRPTLYFWSRFYTGDNDRINVQISVEDGSTEQGYDKIRGWSRWQNVWGSRVGDSSSPDYIPDEFARTYTWERKQVSLQSYVGRRIRVRFVFDAYEQDNNRDGWYIDDISITYREPQRIYTLPFVDLASNLNNWVAEGTWGLAPDVFFGAGGGPASIGPNPWFGYFYRCPNSDCRTNGSRAAEMLDRIPRNNTDSLNAVNNPVPYYGMIHGSVTTTYNRDSASIPVTEVVLDVNHDYRRSGPRGSSWVTDDFAGRWIRDIRVSAGQYTFITVADDGVRMLYVPTGTNLGGSPGVITTASWNMINNWRDQTRQVDLFTADLAQGDYTLVLEWYDNGSDAVIVATVGNNNFSFEDSPKLTPSQGLINDVPAAKRGNSSLVLNGVLDVRNQAGTPNFLPILEYYTYYELNYDSVARVEVSVDGGFTWTQSGLTNNIPSTPPITPDSPTIRNATITPPSDWQRRRHSLVPYIGSLVGLRFRLDRRATDTTQYDNNNSFYVSWWVVNIRVFDIGG